MRRAAVIVTSGVGGIQWWRKPYIQQLLNLTNAQVERLDTVFERERPERIALRRKIAEMDRLLRRTLMRLALYRRLTAEQRSALRQLGRTDDEMRSGPWRDSDR